MGTCEITSGRSRTLSVSRTLIGTSRSGSRAVPAVGTEERRPRLRLHVGGAETETRHAERIEVHAQLRIVAGIAIEEVDQSRRRFDDFATSRRHALRPVDHG